MFFCYISVKRMRKIKIVSIYMLREGRGFEGKNTFMKGEKSKDLQKMADSDIFFPSDGGQVGGAEPLTRGGKCWGGGTRILQFYTCVTQGFQNIP